MRVKYIDVKSSIGEARISVYRGVVLYMKVFVLTER